MDILLIIASILAPVPVLHMWLHALLSFWKKWPLAFYFFVFFLWLFSFWFFLKIPAVLLFEPSAFSSFLGIILAIAGFLLMGLSLFTLGPKRFFVWAVLRPQEVMQKYIASGIFKFIPHPSYTGILLILFGIFILSGRTYLAGAFIFAVSFFPTAIYFEEKELHERLK